MTDLTPAQILNELRDIHVPEASVTPATTVFAPEPFVVLGLLLGALAVLRWWRRTRWRRDARRELDRVDSSVPDASRWGSAALPARSRGPPPSGHGTARRDLAAARAGRGRRTGPAA